MRTWYNNMVLGGFALVLVLATPASTSGYVLCCPNDHATHIELAVNNSCLQAGVLSGRVRHCHLACTSMQHHGSCTDIPLSCGPAAATGVVNRYVLPSLEADVRPHSLAGFVYERRGSVEARPMARGTPGLHMLSTVRLRL